MKSRVWMAFGIAAALIVLAVFGRLIPHPANATPIMATALFGGAYFSQKRWSIVIPLLALFVSDLVIGFHSQMVSVYGCVVLISLLGFALHDKRTVGRVAGFSLIGSTVFFVITNFTVWLSDSLYAPTAQGLFNCYTMALPFFRNELLGDLAYSGVLFGAWALVSQGRTVGSRVSTSKVKNG